MNNITKILLLFLCSPSFSQEPSVSYLLQQKINHISEQIELARASQYLAVNDTEHDKDLLLLILVEPVHTYILTQARYFLPQLSALYDELLEKLLKYAGLEITQYQEILRHALLIKLNEALAQNQEETFVQHVAHIARMLNVQDQLMPTQTASSSNNHQESEMLLAEKVYQPSTELQHTKSIIHPPLRIQELLDANQWTVYQLAEKIGLSRPYISDIKNGKKSCRKDTFRRLAAAFGISIRDLFINPNDYSPDLEELNPLGASLRIQELLDAHQLTVTQLAEKTGLSATYIINIKNGKQSCSNAALQKIAAAFDIEVRDLFINPHDYSPDLEKLNPPAFILRIQELLDAHQWTVSQLAEKTDLSASYIGDIKRGRRGGSKATLRKLATAFGISMRDLFINPHDYSPDLEELNPPGAILRIQELLDAHQWTVSQLAKETGLSATPIIDIKNGKQGCSNATLQKIAAAFGIEVRDLFINPNDCPPEFDFSPTNEFLWPQESTTGSSSIADPDGYIGPAAKRARQS